MNFTRKVSIGTLFFPKNFYNSTFKIKFAFVLHKGQFPLILKTQKTCHKNS